MDMAGQIAAIHRSQAVIEFNMDGTIITANDNFLNAVGYTLEEIQGQHHRMFVKPEYAQSAEYATFWQRLSQGEFFSGEFKRVGKNAKEIWIHASYNPILDQDGKPFKVVKYASDVTEQKRAAAEAAAQGAAIDNAGVSIMMVDRDLRITYANKSTMDLLKKHESTFREAFPGFDPNGLIGACIDDFHKNPSYQRGILSDPRNLPHIADIKIANLVFELNISAIINAEGEYIGNCLEWKDVTVARKAQSQAASLHSMIEGATSMFMTCDKDLVITYCNPAVVRMLQKYESEIRKKLPSFDANKLVGTCIDNFHANPGHQRRVLADVKNLPVSSELKLGPLTFGVTATALLDENGEYIGNGVEWTDFNARESYRTEVNKVIDATGAGDLTIRGDLDKLDETYRPMMQGINEIVDAFETALANVKNPVTEVASASGQIGEGAQKLAEGASTQASSIEEISASLEQMTSMTQQNADNAGEARNLANGAQTSASNGNQTMVRMAEAINAIKTSSDETSKIVKTIDEIAFQTNLLALNAAVEAARAGDAGKGFAVVAEEVRSLAQRSAEAAKNTAELIEGAVKNAENGVNISTEVSGILDEIVEGSTKVSELINEIAAASKEQADGIKQVTEAVDQMNRVTQENAANSEESAAASGQLTQQVNALNNLINSFRLREQAASGSAGFDTAPPQTPAPRQQRAPVTAGASGRPQQAIPLDADELADF